jgi:hypothetical protein
METKHLRHVWELNPTSLVKGWRRREEMASHEQAKQHAAILADGGKWLGPSMATKTKFAVGHKDAPVIHADGTPIKEGVEMTNFRSKVAQKLNEQAPHEKFHIGQYVRLNRQLSQIGKVVEINPAEIHYEVKSNRMIQRLKAHPSNLVIHSHEGQATSRDGKRVQVSVPTKDSEKLD